MQQFGLRLTGIDYEIINDKQEILKKIHELIDEKTIEILILTENIYKIIEQEIAVIEEENNLPLVVKIPNSVQGGK